MVYNKADLIISFKINLLSPWYNWKIAELALNITHSLTHARTHARTLAYVSIGILLVWKTPEIIKGTRLSN